MKKIFIGTSGWSYSWNLGNSLEWYIQNSGLNAIELNMSYYRFPFPNMVKSWAKKGNNLAWIVKIHRSITHFKQLNKESYPIFERFLKIFKPLDKGIHYYLLQLPPKFQDLNSIENFIEKFGKDKIIVELRHPNLFSNDIKKWAKKLGINLVSVDAPGLSNQIMSDSIIYLRIHGKSTWYCYDYNKEEILELKNRIENKKPEICYVFFNNDAMFKNAQDFSNLFKL